jgi:hypothetical protein
MEVRAVRADRVLSAAATVAVMMSFSLARVMPTYSTRISSSRISRLSRSDRASRAMVG